MESRRRSLRNQTKAVVFDATNTDTNKVDASDEGENCRKSSNEKHDLVKAEKKVKTVQLGEEELKQNSDEGKVEENYVLIPKKQMKKGLQNKSRPNERSEKAVDVKKKKGDNFPEISYTRPYKSLGPGPKPVPATGRKYMGSHVSGAGGIWKAFENAKTCSSKSFALFLRNQRSWAAKPLDEDTVKMWKDAQNGMTPHLVLPHGSYLMNLGSPKEEMLEKSRTLFLEELQRCERLGIPHFNFHPGSSLGLVSKEECCKTIAESINLAHKETESVICVLENMCRQGFTVGGDFKELRMIIENVKDRIRVGICIDTCHAHAAGYDLASEEGFNSLLDDFENIIGWQFLRGLHMNDSMGNCGDHKDRHQNIGKGTIGIEGFRRIMNCPKFDDLPLILETPYTTDEGYAKEVRCLEKLIIIEK